MEYRGAFPFKDVPPAIAASDMPRGLFLLSSTKGILSKYLTPGTFTGQRDGACWLIAPLGETAENGDLFDNLRCFLTGCGPLRMKTQ